ncbi:MAG: Hsp20/alpha crystallin family protein [Gammaproteobacteria bacterium]
MFTNNLKKLMWIEALDLLDQAERLHKHFFQPAGTRETVCAWEPPVDIVDTGNSLMIVIALPGVKPEHIKVYTEADSLIVAARRSLSGYGTSSRFQRLEIPYGQFIRKINLSHTGFDIQSSTMIDGCLHLVLQKSQS